MERRLVAVERQDKSASSFANNAMTRLWQDAQDRETGAEAVQAIRARRQQELDAGAKKRSGRWRFLGGR